MTRISVCIASYNGERFIRKQLNTILNQLGENDEVIVSDDSSSDGTVGIVRSYGDPRIKLLTDQKFRSPIFNFENAIKHAQGEYIFLSDQDDLWLESKVEKSMQALADCDLVLSDCKIIDAADNVTEESFFLKNGSCPGLIKNIWKNSYLGCCMAMRRNILERALPFAKDIPMHDWWLGVVGEAFFRIKFIEAPLMCYRRHGVNATPTGEGSHFSYLRRLLFRWNLVKALCKTWIRR